LMKNPESAPGCLLPTPWPENARTSTSAWCRAPQEGPTSISGSRRQAALLCTGPYQGESDTYSAQAASAWPRKFEALVKAFRRDLNLPHLPVVFAQLGKLGGAYAHQAAYNHWETLKRAQEQIDLPQVVMVKADGLETSDGVHLTAASNYELGRIMAEAMDKLAYR